MDHAERVELCHRGARLRDVSAASSGGRSPPRAQLAEVEALEALHHDVRRAARAGAAVADLARRLALEPRGDPRLPAEPLGRDLWLGLAGSAGP